MPVAMVSIVDIREADDIGVVGRRVRVGEVAGQ